MALAAPIWAVEKEVIAIYDLRAEGVPASTASMVTDWIYAAMSNGPYQVVDRSRIRTLLQEQEVQMLGMTDPQGAVQAERFCRQIASSRAVSAGSATNM